MPLWLMNELSIRIKAGFAQDRTAGNYIKMCMHEYIKKSSEESEDFF